MQFRLKAGGYLTGTGAEGDPQKMLGPGDVIESERDLAAEEPERYAKVDESAAKTPAPLPSGTGQPPAVPTPAPASSPAEKEARHKKGW
jgi:hypothetical protein